MIWMLAIAALAAPSWTLWDASPTTEDEPVLVVATPGFARASWLPLVRELDEAGRDVQLLEFSCRDQDATELSAAIAAAAATLPEGTPIVAHGIGATLALRAHSQSATPAYVLLAPVLSLRPVASTRWLAEQPIGLSVDLGEPATWNGRHLQPLLLGGKVELACAPVPFTREVQSWVLGEPIGLDLTAIDADVWIAVSLGDDIASVETTVPLSRSLPRRELVRLGLNRFDGQDFTHGELLTHPTPIAAAVSALGRLR